MRPPRAALLGGLAAALAAGAWAGSGELQSFMVYGHSAALDYARQQAFDLALQQQPRYPRWIPGFQLGYGAPVFNYYAPGFHFLAQLFMAAGASVLSAVQAARFATFLAGAAGMFCLARRFASSFLAPAAAAVLYVFSNYFLLDAYVRASSGELAVLGACPWLLWTLGRLLDRPSLAGALAVSLLFAALILAHNISALLWGAVAAGYAAWVLAAARDRRPLPWIAGALAAGTGWSAFFWVPALFEREYVRTELLTRDYFDYRLHFVFADQLWKDAWDYGASEAGRADTMPVSCGRILLLAWSLALAFLAVRAARAGRRGRSGRAPGLRPETGFLALASAAGLFMALDLSSAVWELLPPLAFVQFPWRFYVVFTPLAVAVLAAGLGALERTNRRVAAGAAVALVLLTLAHQAPRAVGHRTMLAPDTMSSVLVKRGEAPPPGLLEPRRALDESSGWITPIEYLPRWVRKFPDAPSPGAVTVEGQARVMPLHARGGRESFRVAAPAYSILTFDRFYFPGWSAEADGRACEVRPEAETGRMAVLVPPGEYRLDVRFGSTTPRRTGTAMSAATACLFAAGFLLRFRRRS